MKSARGLGGGGSEVTAKAVTVFYDGGTASPAGEETKLTKSNSLIQRANRLQVRLLNLHPPPGRKWKVTGAAEEWGGHGEVGGGHNGCIIMDESDTCCHHNTGGSCHSALI